MTDGAPVVALSGSRTGLGRGLATELLGHGWIVEGCSRGAGDLVHERYHHSQIDVSDDQAVHGWVRGLARKHGRLDAAIANAAAIPVPAPVAGSDGNALAQALAVNAGGTASLLGAAARVMLRQRRGRLIAMSSMATAVRQPGTAAYAASKAAIETWVKVLARELAPSGITCNVIAPSMVETGGLAQLGESGKAKALAALAIQRPLTTAEVAGVVEFLLSPAADVVTGQVIYLGLVP